MNIHNILNKINIKYLNIDITNLSLDLSIMLFLGSLSASFVDHVDMLVLFVLSYGPVFFFPVLL